MCWRGVIPVIIGEDASAGKQLQAEISKNGKCGLITMELSTPGHTTGQHLFVDGGYVHLDRALT